MAGPQPRAITVSPPQHTVLEALAPPAFLPASPGLARAHCLGAAAGQRNEPLAAQLACSPLTVRKWRARWAAAEARLAAAEAEPAASARRTVAATLADAPRSGAPDTFSAEQIVQIINLACTRPRALAARSMPGRRANWLTKRKPGHCDQHFPRYGRAFFKAGRSATAPSAATG